MSVIEVRDLRKEYRINKKKEGLRGAVVNLFHPKYENKVAVDNISFSIEKGEMVGYIGANGAGKSTTIKMLTGILTPTSGEVLVNGLVPYKNRIKNNIRIGAVFGQRGQLWWDIPVIESYRLIQKMYEVPKDVFQANLALYTEILDLGDLVKIPVRQLSLGQKMRCEIAGTFIHDPEVVFLDEPTIGLDVLVKDKIRDFIKEINKQKNITVILTTHDMQDIEEICSRVIMIDKGSIIYDGDLHTVKGRFGNQRVIKFKVKDVREGLRQAMEVHPDCMELLLLERYDIAIKFSGRDTTAAKIMEIVSQYCEVIDLSVEETSIESIVKEIFGK